MLVSLSLRVPQSYVALVFLFISETISVTDIRTQFLMERAYPTGHILMWRSVSLYILRDIGGSENITFA
jgi:hypothetical protein